jgi:hypothetical protein
MAKPRFYAVAKGRQTGIFDQWNGGARAHVDGFAGALYKSFATTELAELWWAEQVPGKTPQHHFERTTAPTAAPTKTGQFFTYLIVDPRTDMPFYVGQTHCMKSRQRGHLQIGEGKQRPYKRVIAEILAAGLAPEFRVVDKQSTEADSLRSETEWVKRLASQGIRVMNRWKEHQDWMDAILAKGRVKGTVE